LLSALVVRAEDGGKGLPGQGWFDFAQRLGLMADQHDEDAKLRVWSTQLEACFTGGLVTYPTDAPVW
jgi:hypothetical protein